MGSDPGVPGVGVLISGRGSNLQALSDASRMDGRRHGIYPEAVATVLAGGWRVEGRRFTRSR